MVIRKVIQHGDAIGCTFPPPYIKAAGLMRGDIVSVELVQDDGILIKRVDIKALVAMRQQNAKVRKQNRAAGANGSFKPRPNR